MAKTLFSRCGSLHYYISTAFYSSAKTTTAQRVVSACQWLIGATVSGQSKERLMKVFFYDVFDIENPKGVTVEVTDYPSRYSSLRLRDKSLGDRFIDRRYVEAIRM